MFLSVAACALALAAPARAEVIEQESTATPVAAYGSYAAWSRAEGKQFRLVIWHDGAIRRAAVAPRNAQFDVDLGRDAAGRTVAVYSRCPNITRPGTGFMPLPFGYVGCDLYEYDIAGRRERRLAGPSTKAGSEYLAGHLGAPARVHSRHQGLLPPPWRAVSVRGLGDARPSLSRAAAAAPGVASIPQLREGHQLRPDEDRCGWAPRGDGVAIPSPPTTPAARPMRPATQGRCARWSSTTSSPGAGAFSTATATRSRAGSISENHPWTEATSSTAPASKNPSPRTRCCEQSRSIPARRTTRRSLPPTCAQTWTRRRPQAAGRGPH